MDQPYEAFKSSTGSARLEFPGLRHFIAMTQPGPSMQDYEALIKSGTSAEPNVDVELDDLASLNYTSGTTCVLKAAMLTHRNRICMAEKQSLIPGIVVGRKSILCHVEPLTHESYTITS